MKDSLNFEMRDLKSSHKKSLCVVMLTRRCFVIEKMRITTVDSCAHEHGWRQVSLPQHTQAHLLLWIQQKFVWPYSL